MFISVGVLTLATVWLYRLDVLSIVGLSIGLVLSAYYLKQSLDMVRTLTNTTAKALLKGSILYLVLFMLGSVL
jgi:heme O synthase-like polyprenyltransferase